MKVVILGAGGVVGQHLLVVRPPSVRAVFCRQQTAHPFRGINLTDYAETVDFLDAVRPDVILNLAGENNVDKVEKDPFQYTYLNSQVPAILGEWADAHDAHLVQTSTQAVFSGDNPPYGWDSTPDPVNAYGNQKAAAERAVAAGQRWTIARLTFVVGRRLLGGGRPNPTETMLQRFPQQQVDDRHFSPVFAQDAAIQLWRLVQAREHGRICHIGIPRSVNRYALARMIAPAGTEIRPVTHGSFRHAAPRPLDTTWESGSLYSIGLEEGVERLIFRREFERTRS